MSLRQLRLPQAILESGWGEHHIGDANNYFGIKAFKRPDGTINFGSIAIGFVEVPTREVINGESVVVNAFFRKYNDMTDSFRDHGHFLRDNSRYAQAFNFTADSDEFARQIHHAGYATDPHYADALIKVMRNNNLYQFNLSTGSVDGSQPLTIDLASMMGWQEALAELGFNPGSIDGIDGPQTRAAARDFQSANGLVPDGIIGPMTLAALRLALQNASIPFEN